MEKQILTTLGIITGATLIGLGVYAQKDYERFEEKWGNQQNKLEELCINNPISPVCAPQEWEGRISKYTKEAEIQKKASNFLFGEGAIVLISTLLLYAVLHTKSKKDLEKTPQLL